MHVVEAFRKRTKVGASGSNDSVLGTGDRGPTIGYDLVEEGVRVQGTRAYNEFRRPLCDT